MTARAARDVQAGAGADRRQIVVLLGQGVVPVLPVRLRARRARRGPGGGGRAVRASQKSDVLTALSRSLF